MGPRWEVTTHEGRSSLPTAIDMRYAAIGLATSNAGPM